MYAHNKHHKMPREHKEWNFLHMNYLLMLLSCSAIHELEVHYLRHQQEASLLKVD